MAKDNGVDDGDTCEIIDPKEDVLTLEPTVWEVAPLFFLRLPSGRLFLPVAHIIQTVFLLIANFIIQAAYCWWAIGYIQTRSISEEKIEGALWIRLSKWHHFSNMHYPTMETMTVRTCNEQVWTTLEEVYQDLASYLSSMSWDGALPGPAMAMLALLVWTLLMTGELHRTIKIAWTIGKMEADRDHVVGTAVQRDGDSFVVNSMSKKSKALILGFVQFPRLVVCFGLLCVGLWFLGTTYQTEDLLLNAVAFQVIKDVDELLFAALAPADLARRLTLVTLRSKRPPLFATLYRSSAFWLCRLGFVIVVLISCHYGMSVDIQETVTNLSDKLCSSTSKLDFTWTRHPISNFPVITDVSAEKVSDARVDELKCYYSAQYNMLKVYSGFGTTDANTSSLIDGSNAVCQSSPKSCGFFDITDLRKAHYYSRQAAILDTDFCMDNILALHLILKECTGEKQHSSLSSALSSIHSCFDVTKLFECQENATCSYRSPDYQNFAGIYSSGLTEEWMEILMNTCPKSTGLCNEVLEAHNNLQNITRSRRLDQQPSLTPPWLSQQAPAELDSPSSTAWRGSVGGGTVSAMDAEDRIQRLERESTELAQQLREERQRTQEVVQRLENTNAALARQVEELQKTVFAISSQMRVQAADAQI